MIVICPQCNTRYNVPLTAVPPTGRKTRCQSCGHVWMEGAPPEEAISAFAAADAAPPPPASAPEPEEETLAEFRPAQAKPMVRTPKARGKPLPWNKIAAGVAFLFVSVAGGGLLFRASLADAFPALGGVYEKIGLPAGNVDEWFERVELQADRHVADDQLGLLVRGRYRNVSNRAREAPQVRVFWQGAGDNGAGAVGPLVSVAAEPLEVPPGEEMSFSAVLSGMDMSRGGQAGAVLAGGRYDERLRALVEKTDDAPAATPKAEEKPAAPEPSHGH